MSTQVLEIELEFPLVAHKIGHSKKYHSGEFHDSLMFDRMVISQAGDYGWSMGSRPADNDESGHMNPREGWKTFIGGILILPDCNWCEGAYYGNSPPNPANTVDPITNGLDIHPERDYYIKGVGAHSGDSTNMARTTHLANPNDCTVSLQYLENDSSYGVAPALKFPETPVPDHLNPFENPTGQGICLELCNSGIYISIPWRKGGYSAPGGFIRLATVRTYPPVKFAIYELRLINNKAFVKENGIEISPQGGITLPENNLIHTENAYPSLVIQRWHFGHVRAREFNASWPSSSCLEINIETTLKSHNPDKIIRQHRRTINAL